MIHESDGGSGIAGLAVNVMIVQQGIWGYPARLDQKCFPVHVSERIAVCATLRVLKIQQ